MEKEIIEFERELKVNKDWWLTMYTLSMVVKRMDPINQKWLDTINEMDNHFLKEMNKNFIKIIEMEGKK